VFLLKKFLLSITIILALLSFSVQAANVGVVVLIPNGTIYSDCITINNGQSAYNAFQKMGLNMKWQNFGFGYFLESVEGYSSDNNAEKYWSFWHSNNQGTNFQAAMVGASDYEISTDDKLIGLSLTAFDIAYNPITSPPFFDYDSLCTNAMKISSVKFYIDSESKSVAEGDKIKVKPGSNIKIIVKIQNMDTAEDLNNVEVKGVIYDLDNDLDDSDETDIKKGDKDELELNFKIPLDADDDKYDLELTITGEGKLNYKKTLNYKVDVSKDKHELKVSIPNADTITCGREWTLNLKVTNIGEEDEDVTFRVFNVQLGLLSQSTMSIDSSDEKTKAIIIKIPSNAKGNYPITTNVEYSGLSDEYTTSLTINCDSQATVINTQNAVQQNQQNNPQQTSADGKTLKDETKYVFVESSADKSGDVTKIVLLVFANVLLVGFIIFLVLK